MLVYVDCWFLSDDELVCHWWMITKLVVDWYKFTKVVKWLEASREISKKKRFAR